MLRLPRIRYLSTMFSGVLRNLDLRSDRCIFGTLVGSGVVLGMGCSDLFRKIEEKKTVKWFQIDLVTLQFKVWSSIIRISTTEYKRNTRCVGVHM